ncbi:hypothetical protein DUI87_34426 [Hirundo rustica rustica]|uniref:Uncharacterized protein n=1 Tax=Hirundo rustica rustica TaxID=333673 RepID=A0A3M0IK73_HIRRU|nr:hypothetical protein DUI87_34426 [Hirundo rustica rustica]
MLCGDESLEKGQWQAERNPSGLLRFGKTLPPQVEKLTVKVRHGTHMCPRVRLMKKSITTMSQVDKGTKVKVSQVDLDWQHKRSIPSPLGPYASGHQGRDATYRWARDQGVDLTMDNISQVITTVRPAPAIKQAKRVKPLWYGGRWLKYRYGEAWQIDYITFPKPARASVMCDYGGKPPLDGGDYLCLMLLLS